MKILSTTRYSILMSGLGAAAGLLFQRVWSAVACMSRQIGSPLPNCKHMGFNNVRWLVGTAALLAGVCFTVQPVNARDGKWIEANGVMLRYELSGAGKDTVVLLHDMGMNLEIWDEAMPAIGVNRRVLRYDLRGFGLSEKIRAAVKVEDHVEDLRSLLDALHVDRPVILVGESIGGALALKFAAKYPQRVKAVASLNGLIRMPMEGPPANPNLRGRDTAKLIETEGVRAYLATDLDWLYPKELRTPERVNRLMGIEVAQDPQVRANTMRMQNMAADIDIELPNIKCPVLLIAGMLNSTYTEEQWRVVAKTIQNAKLELIKSGHHAVFESPQLVAPLLQRFLAEQGGR